MFLVQRRSEPFRLGLVEGDCLVVYNGMIALREVQYYCFVHNHALVIPIIRTMSFAEAIGLTLY